MIRILRAPFEAFFAKRKVKNIRIAPGPESEPNAQAIELEFQDGGPFLLLAIQLDGESIEAGVGRWDTSVAQFSARCPSELASFIGQTLQTIEMLVDLTQDIPFPDASGTSRTQRYLAARLAFSSGMLHYGNDGDIGIWSVGNPGPFVDFQRC